MNYWHMQLHPDNKSWGREEELLKKRKIIGLGDYKKRNSQEDSFESKMEINDIVLIKKGETRIALVQITGEYIHTSDTDDLAWFNSRRNIKILDILTNPLPDFPQPRQALQKLVNKSRASYKMIDRWYKQIIKENFMKEKINLLKNRSQIILQGPPGTGKTRVAKQMAISMINAVLPLYTNDEIKDSFEKISNQVKLIQFHPSYSYEDFVRGIVAKSTTTTTGIEYKTENKVLVEMAEKALNDEEKRPYVLIIDEINRANLSSVLGELIYALEYRDEAVESMYELEGSRKITLPSNLYIIGTMNTADRSVGHIDYAIRRRFAFESVLPDESVIDLAEGKTLFSKVEEIFENISMEFDKDDVMLGHSYFIADDEEKLNEKLKYQVKPLLREYVKDGVLIDSDKLKEIIKTL